MVVIIDHSYVQWKVYSWYKSQADGCCTWEFSHASLWKLVLLVLASTSTLISLIFHPNNSLLVYVNEKLTVKIWVKIRLVHQEMLYKQLKPHMRNIRIKSPVSHPLVSLTKGVPACCPQSHKEQKLSGQQDFSCKNFPDKARKSRHRRIRDKCA